MTIDRHTVVAIAGTTKLDVKSGTITMDDTRAPFVQGSLTIATPDDDTIIDPYTPARVHISLGQQYDALGLTRDLGPLWEDLTVTSDLAAWWAPATITADVFPDRVRYDGSTDLIYGSGREMELVVVEAREMRDGTTELELESLETLLTELPFFNSVKVYYPERTLRGSLDAVMQTLADNGHVWPTEILAGRADVPMILQTDPDGVIGNYLVMRPGDSIWDAYGPTMQDAALIFRDLGRGGIEIIDADYTTTDTITITDGDAGTVIDFEIEMSRRSRIAGDAALVVYDEGQQDFYLASASSNTGWNRPLVIRQPGYSPINQFGFPGPGGGWSLIADRTLARAERRRRELPVTAVNNYDATPRAALTLTVDGTTFTGIVQSVRFDLVTTWEMTLTAINLEATP